MVKQFYPIMGYSSKTSTYTFVIWLTSYHYQQSLIQTKIISFQVPCTYGWTTKSKSYTTSYQHPSNTAVKYITLSKCLAVYPQDILFTADIVLIYPKIDTKKVITTIAALFNVNRQYLPQFSQIPLTLRWQTQ